MERRRLDFYPDSNEDFAYIAGYTPAGFPFGITWEEMERFNELESLIEMLEQEKMGEAEKLQQMTDMEEWLAFLAKEEKNGQTIHLAPYLYSTTRNFSQALVKHFFT